MSASTTSAPELTREQVQAILVQPLQAASVFLAAGPRIFDVTAAGPVRIPTMVGMDAPSWVGENVLIPEVEAEFGEVRLLDGILSLKSLTRFSNELARSSIVALDAALRDRMVLDVAAKLDHALIAGDGDVVAGKRTTPLGIVNYAGTQEILAAGDPSLDVLLDAVGLLMAANVDPTRCRVFMRSDAFIAFRKLKDSSGKYLLQPDPTQDGVFRVLGLPVTITNRLPADGGVGLDESSIVLADMSKIAVARDLAPSVKLLDQTFAAFDQQAIRVVAHYDAAPLNPEAIVVVRGVTPAA